MQIAPPATVIGNVPARFTSTVDALETVEAHADLATTRVDRAQVLRDAGRASMALQEARTGVSLLRAVNFSGGHAATAATLLRGADDALGSADRQLRGVLGKLPAGEWSLPQAKHVLRSVATLVAGAVDAVTGARAMVYGR